MSFLKNVDSSKKFSENFFSFTIVLFKMCENPKCKSSQCKVCLDFPSFFHFEPSFSISEDRLRVAETFRGVVCRFEPCLQVLTSTVSSEMLHSKKVEKNEKTGKIKGKSASILRYTIFASVKFWGPYFYVMALAGMDQQDNLRAATWLLLVKDTYA